MTLDAGIRKYKEAATFIVAASDSLHKERADFVCDGVDDQVEIQAAIDALPAGGGCVQLLEGVFHTSAAIILNAGTILKGMGNIWGTDINLDNNSDCNVVECNLGTAAGITLSNLTIYGNKTNQATGWCAYLDGGYDHLVERVFFTSGKSGGLYIDSWAPRVLNSIFEFHEGTAFERRGSGLRMDNCFAGDNDNDGFHFVENQAVYSNVANTQAYNNGGTGFIVNYNYNIFTNCIATSNGADGFYFGLAPAQRSSCVACMAVDNVDKGFELRAPHIILVGCLARGNGIGLFKDSNPGCVLVGNLITANTTDVSVSYITSSSLFYTQHSDIFMDVLAASNVHIHAAQAGNSASQDVAATTQPDIPRNTKLTTTNNGQVLEGSLCDDGGTVTDETADINNVAANDVPLLPAAPEENDAIYFGNYGKFDKLTIDIGTQGVKAPGDWSISWEYWDGDSWEALAGVADGTAEFTAAAGNHDVTFTVPSDWAEKEIDITAGGSITAYWIRARVDAATTNPIGAQPLADQGWIGIYGTVTVTGVDAKGNSTTNTLLITRTNAGGTVALDVAFAIVTKYNIPAGVSAANTVACGIGIKLGLSNIIYETGDVYKIKKNNADATVAVAQVDTDYDTYDMSVIGLGATNDFTIWFKSNLNIIS